MIAGPLAVAVLMVWLAGYTGPDRPSALPDFAWVLLSSAPWALGWLIAAFGYGWPLRRWLLGGGPDWAAVQMGLGVAAMLTLDAGLGAPSHAAASLEMGADAVLINTAIATAENPVVMADSFRLGVEAGRRAFLAGAPPEKDSAEASSPLTGFLGDS